MVRCDDRCTPLREAQTVLGGLQPKEGSIGIPPEELGRNIFLNGEISALDRTVKDGDRLGIFPDDMQLLYRQYFPRKGGDEG